VDKTIDVFTSSGVLAQVPKSSRFLRRTATHSPFTVKRGLTTGDECFEVAFGLPWTFEGFINKAVERGHPANFCKLVPKDLADAIEFHVLHTCAEVSEYRLMWCKRWLQRAAELDREEKRAAKLRHPSTTSKRLMLTREILASIEYEDVEALKILEEGSTLAGEIESAPVFQKSYKPCVATIEQLEENAEKRNSLVLSMTKPSASLELDVAVLQETRDEISKGWADGPWKLEQLERGATISRRFPLSQGEKTRMIDDYSVSGVNDSCTIHSKLDLHMVDTFVAVIKSYFEKQLEVAADCSLVAKTYDLKSAYRQIAVRADHLRYAYFCIYNHELQAVEIYRSRTLPFGATHSVFSFLRLAKMIHSIACRGPKLLTTNFYDDFILASPSQLQESSRSSLELVFMFTGWEFAREGKKATEFAGLCSALGVTFDLKDSKDGVLEIRNTEKRINDLVAQLEEVILRKTLNRPETLRLKGRLGFADGFLHGRLGALILKRLVDHAYSFSNVVDSDLANVLQLMIRRLKHAGPKKVDATTVKEWSIFADASFDGQSGTGGLGGVLVDSHGDCCAWFSVCLNKDVCNILGATNKETIIYELEMLASCLAMDLWASCLASAYPVLYGDNDSVRFALIRGTGLGVVANTIMQQHLETEVNFNTNVWFARVPTEANIADIPSRFLSHPFLPSTMDESSKAWTCLERFLKKVQQACEEAIGRGEGDHLIAPHVRKRKRVQVAAPKQT
jgi:hypothetical protein